jgi:hypothetical protein
MDARLVWQTWRRILTSDQLIDWIMIPEDRAADPDGFTAKEMAILADYAVTPAATASNIGMYRRGLARNALGALDLVPLTRQLLRTGGLDMDEVATEFTRCASYADNGPNFWKTAAGFVTHIASLPEFASHAHQDVLAIDTATIALARRLGDSAVTMWPDNAAARFSAGGPNADTEPARFVANRAAAVVLSHCDLTPWIENPFNFDCGNELEHSRRHWLIYFPSAEASQEYAELSERAARIFDLLKTPKTAEELSQAQNGLPLADVLTVTDSLAELGVLVLQSADTCRMDSHGNGGEASR